MASRQFLDPITILRATPLLSATCTLFYAWDQHFFLSMFNNPTVRKPSNAVLPQYFRLFFQRSVVSILSTITITLGAAIANTYVARGPATSWYKAGAWFAGAHLLFVPVVAPSVQAILTNHPARDANAALDDWIWINAFRGLSVDLAAWATLSIATIKTLSG